MNGRRLLILCAAAALSVPASAGGATYTVPDKGEATCLRPTGVPGELAAFGRGSEKGVRFDILAGDSGAVSRRAGINIGPTYTCVESASGGGVTVVAGATISRDFKSTGITAVVREGGGAFTPPVALTGSVPPDFGPSVPSVAVGPAGDAVVAWAETRGDLEQRDSQFRVVIARRSPGGAFGAPEPLTPWQKSGYDGSKVTVAGVDESGTATIAWARPLPEGTTFSSASVVETSTIAKGAPSGTLQRLSGRIADGSEVAADMSADGRALVAWNSLDGISYAERPPGSAGFGPATALVDTFEGPDPAALKATPDVSVAADGSAAVTWITATGDGSRAGIEAAWRRAGGAFRPPVEVWSAPTDRRTGETDPFALPRTRPKLNAAGSSGGTIDTGGGGIIVVDDSEPTYSVYDTEVPRVALSDTGTITLTWTGRELRDDGSRGEAWVATGSVDDAALGQPRKLSNDCRSTSGVQPLEGGSGPLVAWADNVTNGYLPYEEFATGSGRIHVTAPSDERPAANKVEIDVSGPRGLKTIYFDQPVSIGVRCDGPCDLRAWAPDRLTATGAALPSGGRTELKLVGSTETHLAPKGRGGGPVKVKVRACDPVYGTVVDERSVTMRLARHALPKYVPARDVHARRSGNRVIVTWTTAGPATRHVFTVAGQTVREPEGGDDIVDAEITEGRSKQRFRAVLRGKNIRWVQVLTTQRDRPRSSKSQILRVTG